MTPHERFSVTLQAVTDAFNAHANSYGYKQRAKATLPVVAHQLTDREIVLSATPAVHCRHLAALIVSRHLTMPDVLDGEQVLMKYETIAKLFGRSTVNLWKSRRWACAAVQKDPYFQVYKDALRNMRKAGVEPFGTPRRCQ